MAQSYRTNDWNSNLNLVFYASLIMAGIGVSWLALNEIQAGIRYITILLIGIGFLTLTFFFIDEYNKNRMKKLIKLPFTTDYDVASGMYILGWSLPIGINLISKLLNFQFSVSQIMVPLAGTTINLEISQSLSVAKTQYNPFWQWFISVFTAGTIEEFVFGFVLMLVGVNLAIMIWALLYGKAELNTNSAKWFYTLFGLAFTGAIFGGAHLLNSTYVGYMFIIAIAFRLIMNYSLYYLGIFLVFTLGYHQSNNAVWFWGEYGPSITIEALSSVGGIIIILYFALILFSVFRRIDIVWAKLKKVFSNLGLGG